MATFLLAASSLARADENKIRLENAWARKAPAVAPGGAAKHGAPATGMGNGAVYVTIQNGSRHGDAVIAATSDAAGKVELHETVNEGGVMRMRPLPKFTVPAGGKLEMKPGSYHIMLLGLTRDLKPGDTVKVTLTFEKAGKMEVNAPVREGP
jgi:hypothetical protein